MIVSNRKKHVKDSHIIQLDKELKALKAMGLPPRAIRAWQAIVDQGLRGNVMMANLRRNIMKRLEKDIRYIATLI